MLKEVGFDSILKKSVIQLQNLGLTNRNLL